MNSNKPIMNVDMDLNVAVMPTMPTMPIDSTPKRKLSNHEKPMLEKLLNKTIGNLNRIGYYTNKTNFEVLNAIDSMYILQEKINELRREMETVKSNLMDSE